MKKLLAVLAGLAVALTVIVLAEWVIHRTCPMPENITLTDFESIKAALGRMPSWVMVLVIVAHALGSLAGGATVGRILREDTMNVGMTLGAILTALGMANMVIFNYPEWFYVDLLAFMPCAMFGANYTSKL